jgi:hypothetical protein
MTRRVLAAGSFSGSLIGQPAPDVEFAARLVLFALAEELGMSEEDRGVTRRPRLALLPQAKDLSCHPD